MRILVVVVGLVVASRSASGTGGAYASGDDNGLYELDQPLTDFTREPWPLGESCP